MSNVNKENEEPQQQVRYGTLQKGGLCCASKRNALELGVKQRR
jgi:hypothetical protein